MKCIRILFCSLLILPASLAGCIRSEDHSISPSQEELQPTVEVITLVESEEPPDEPVEAIIPAQEEAESVDFRFLTTVYQHQDRNRYVEGKGSMPDARVVDLPLGGVPEWTVGAPDGEGGSYWVVVFGDGSVEAFHVSEGVTWQSPQTMFNHTPGVLLGLMLGADW